METAISPLKTMVNPSDYWDSKIPERRWELCYSYKDKIYLTNEEKEQFMNMVKSGKTIVEIGGNFITTKFLYLIAIRNEPIRRKYVEVTDDQGNICFREELAY